MGKEDNKSWGREIIIGVAVAVIAAVIIARLGLDKTPAEPPVNLKASANPAEPPVNLKASARSDPRERMAPIIGVRWRVDPKEISNDETFVFFNDGTGEYSMNGGTEYQSLQPFRWTLKAQDDKTFSLSMIFPNRYFAEARNETWFLTILDRDSLELSNTGQHIMWESKHRFLRAN